MAATDEQHLRAAADMLSEPHLLEVLVATASGRSPREAVPVSTEGDLESLNAAINRLAAFGAVEEPGSDGNQPLILTDRGQVLLALLDELGDSLPSATDARADPAHPTLTEER